MLFGQGSGPPEALGQMLLSREISAFPETIINFAFDNKKVGIVGIF